MDKTKKEIQREVQKIKRIDRDFPSNDWCETVIITLEWALGKEWPDELASARGGYP